MKASHRFFQGLVALALTALLSLALTTPLRAAGELARAQAARATFLQKLSQHKRSDWLALIIQFEEAAQAQSRPEPAAKARYLGAELAWLSYERFGQIRDAEQARTLARRVIRDCPKCEAAPGAQVLIGRALIAEDKLDEAYRELLKVEMNFPRSSERVTARNLLTSLRANRTPPPAPEERPAGANGPKTAQPPKPDQPAQPIEPRPNSPRTSTASPTPPKTAGRSPAQKAHLAAPTRPQPRSDGRAQVYGLGLLDQGDYEEVVVFVDAVVPYVYNMIPPTPGGRFRVYVDFKGTRLRPNLKTNLGKSQSLVKLVKISQLTEDTARLVVDLPQAYPYRPLFLENPSRLVIQVAKDRDALPRPEPEAPPTPPVKPPKPTPPASATTRPARGPANSLARQLGLKIRRVVIDPGHGGKDGGAADHGLREKDIVLKASLLLAEKIRQRLGLTVILTRNSDKFITLDRRARIARENEGDIFISIHVNANSLAKVQGFESYILNFTDDRTAMETAARENAVSDKTMSEMFNILELIAKNTRVAESRVLAKALHSGALSALGKKHKVRDLGVKEAVFIVLANVSVPSVLLEIGFITNAAEAEKLSQSEYLDLMTDGLVNGLKSYLAGLPK
ncbi:MAG: N-acetylmuramoyl-L-alanine amidase [Deltaproteobacteria bacterium]|nr:N-acetylmuramoyl-L-alanine amidase [Deltaproteobacteria bacterium]